MKEEKKQSEVILNFIDKLKPIMPSPQKIKEFTEWATKYIKDTIKPDKKV